MIKFHKTQEKAIDFLANAITNRKPIVGLTGAGGTGKSEILSTLVNKPSEELDNREIFVSASTNKAAARLKEELPDTTTLHSAVSMPRYTALYNNLENYYNEEEETDLMESTKAYIKRNRIKLDDHEGINYLIASLGKTVFDEDFFNGYMIKEPVHNSCLIIDEASMVSMKSGWKDNSLITIGVDTASQVYDTIILVGDMNQLPPINGKSSFDDIEVIELTKNYRSNKGLLKCIDYVRKGGNLHNYKPEKEESVKIVSGIGDNWYKSTYMRTDVVHLAYQNKTRHSIVKKIRGNNGWKPLEGEPVLYRGYSNGRTNKGDIGIYKNGIVEFQEDEMKIKSYQVFDEYNKKGWSIYSYGYAMTVHSAQGSGFDHVIVHAYDIPHFIDEITKNQWIYTAVSRAKKSLTIIL